jgi:hypothetical protein
MASRPLSAEECCKKRGIESLESRLAAHSTSRGQKVERETGFAAPSTNHSVEFTYRLG